MASEDPKCPDCHGPIATDWDWCMHCGYDPDHLKPWDWRPGPAGGSLQTATAPGQVGLIDLTDRKRRGKKAERTKRKGRTGKADHPEPKVATMATTASLITLPTPPRAPATPTARPAPTAPAPQQATAPGAAAPAAARQPMPAAPAPAAGPVTPEPAPAPRFDMTSPLRAPVPGPAPAAARPSTRVITLPKSTLSMVPSVVLYVLGGLMLFVGLSSMTKLGEGSVLSRASTVLFVLVCLALACGMAGQGYTFMKVRVEIGPNEIVAHNRFGRPSRARVRDIFSVTLGSRRYLDLPVVGRAVEAPYVQMQDGSGFWLDALEGRNGEPPTPEQLAVVDALARVVAANRNVALQDDAAGGLV